MCPTDPLTFQVTIFNRVCHGGKEDSIKEEITLQRGITPGRISAKVPSALQKNKSNRLRKNKADKINQSIKHSPREERVRVHRHAEHALSESMSNS